MILQVSSRLVSRPAMTFLAPAWTVGSRSFTRQVAPTLPKPTSSRQVSTSSTPSEISDSITQSYVPPPPTTMFIPPAEDPLLSLMTNVIMKDGKRHRAQRIITDMLSYLHTITLSPPLPIVREAIRLASPSVKIVTMRNRSKNIPSPRPLNDRQRAKTAFKWILKQSESRSDLSVSRRLAKEMVAVIRASLPGGPENEVLKKVETVHKMAVVNRYVFLIDRSTRRDSADIGPHAGRTHLAGSSDDIENTHIFILWNRLCSDTFWTRIPSFEISEDTPFYAYYILNTPNPRPCPSQLDEPFVCALDSLVASARPSPTASRVSSGAIMPSSHKRAVEYSAVDCASIFSLRLACCEGSLRLQCPSIHSLTPTKTSTYFDTWDITCDSCPDPITDTFADGHIHKKRGEYCKDFINASVAARGKPDSRHDHTCLEGGGRVDQIHCQAGQNKGEPSP